ncbi:sensor histidine kinase [Actinokineospora enzanensis]|uniref:sensor histidine kinase n=1 Tax=Actinokineospora enzanensis TaxID=155975 RepID=UPI0003AA9EA5|nr:histidine kinase [Actinokineospora enzanensis]
MRIERLWHRVTGVGPSWLVDGVLGAVACTALLSVGPTTPGSVACDVGVAIGLAASRRLPMAGYLLGSAALMAQGLWSEPNVLVPYANLIGLYNLGAHATPRRALVGPALVVPGVLAFSAREPVPMAAAVGTVFVWLLIWAVGFASARARERQSVEAALTRAAAAADERARMARELHDLVGHTVNVMLVQAGASRLVLDTDPEQARALLSGVERTGREALEELDRVLGGLRPDDPGPDLERLAARMAEADMAVTLDIDAPELPGAVELAAYRIVQEALTNALKHGRATSAHVTVRHSADGTVIEIRDNGRGARAYQPGRGLTGIAERAAVLGGAVTHGPVPGGGFQVRVTLR